MSSLTELKNNHAVLTVQSISQTNEPFLLIIQTKSRKIFQYVEVFTELTIKISH